MAYNVTLEYTSESLAQRRAFKSGAPKLVAQLNGKGKSGKSSLTFLEDTLDIYTRYKKLQRYRALKAGTTPAGKDLWDKLFKELSEDPLFGDAIKAGHL